MSANCNIVIKKELFDLKCKIDKIDSKLSTISRKISSTVKAKRDMQNLHDTYSEKVKAFQNSIDTAINSDNALININVSHLQETAKSMQNKQEKDYQKLSDQIKLIFKLINKNNSAQITTGNNNNSINKKIETLRQDIKNLQLEFVNHKKTLHELQNQQSELIYNMQKQMDRLLTDRESLRQSHNIVTSFFDSIDPSFNTINSKRSSISNDTIEETIERSTASNDIHQCHMIWFDKSIKLILLRLSGDCLYLGDKSQIAYDDILRLDDGGNDSSLIIWTKNNGNISLQAESKQDQSYWMSKIWDHVIFKNCKRCFSNI